MPKIKLRGWQFAIIRDALNDLYAKKRLEYYQLLRDALGEDFDISLADDVDLGVFHSKKEEALTKHEHLVELYEAKINLFKAEHCGTPLTASEKEQLAELNAQLKKEDAIIASITAKLHIANSIKKMAIVVESKISDVDIIEKYDDEPKLPPIEYEEDDDDFFPKGGNWGD